LVKQANNKMENFRIESLEINKIGAFEHIKMDFPNKNDPNKAEIHILTGENGTGKSTILEVLTIILDEKPGRDTNTNFKKSVAGKTEYKFRVQNEKKLSRYIINQQKVIEERKPYELAVFAYSGYRRISEIRVIGPQKIDDSPLKDCIDFNKSINPYNLIQWIVNTKTSELSNKGRGDNQKAQLFKKTLGILENVISEITNQTVQFDIDIDDNFDVLLEINKLSFSFDVMPDGLKSMTLWLGDLLMRMDRIKWKDDLPIFERNFILFLDEIEVHLHPAWQRKILPVVQKLFKNAQIFISTHSPFVVGSVDGAWVHKLKKDGAFAVLDGEPILSEDGKSVRRILDETFGINQQYGVEVEKDLERFREFRQKIMLGYKYNLDEFDKLVKHLASQSTELEQMMGMEMNQLKRITQKELV
jgi:predicted ATP-binding protein involved in virulence